MKQKIIMHITGSIMPITVKALKGDLPLIAVTQSRAMIKYFEKYGFQEIKDTTGDIPELAIIMNLRFRASPATRRSRVVATSETMLHSLTSRFAREFRKSSEDRYVICSILIPKKTWSIFRNLGIHREAFGNYDYWRQQFTIGYDHPAGHRVIRGSKNIDLLTEAVKPFIQENQ